MKYLKYLSIALVSSSFALGTLSSCKDDNNNPEFKEAIKITIDNSTIKDKLQKLEQNSKAIEELQKALESVATIQEKVQELEKALAKVTTTEEKIATFETAIASITKKTEGLEAAKKMLEEQDKTLGNNNKSMEHRLKQLEGLWANLTMEGVDLGTDVLWAPMNLGASSETTFGGYYSWGELMPKDRTDGEVSDFSVNNYKFNKDTKYNNSDHLKQLAPADDAATQTMGTDWHIPTQKDFQDIITQCDWEYKENYNNSGTHGFLVKNKKDPNKFIFIPHGGYYENAKKLTPSRNYVDAYLWTSTLHPNTPTDYSKAVEFSSKSTNKEKKVDSQLPRAAGLNIRPVCKKTAKK